MQTHYAAADKGPNLLLQAAPQTAMLLESEEGQVSMVYAHKEPRPALHFRVTKTAATAGVRFVTLVIPYLGDVSTASVHVIGNPAPGADTVELQIKVDNDSYRVGYDLDTRKATLQLRHQRGDHAL